MKWTLLTGDKAPKINKLYLAHVIYECSNESGLSYVDWIYLGKFYGRYWHLADYNEDFFVGWIYAQ